MTPTIWAIGEGAYMGEEGSFLDELEGYDESEEAKAEPEESPEAESDVEEATSAQPKEDESEDEEPEDFDPEDPAEQTPEARKGLRKALEASRKKQQETAERLARLEGQLAAYSEQRKGSDEPDVDPDEKLAEAFYEDPAKAIRSVEEKLRAEYEQIRFIEAEESMREKHEDYDSKISEFVSTAQANPAVLAQYNATPARKKPSFAYNYAKQLERTGGVSSVEDLEKAIEARVRKQLEQEMRRKKAANAAEQASTSSAGVSNSGARKQHSESTADEDFGAALGNNY